GIDICIISTAQQARPKVIHISEPVRAQVMRSSTAVMMKPLSASSLLTPVKNGSSAPIGLPVGGSRMPLGAGATRVIESIPLQRPLLPLIYEADGQDAKEEHHRPEAEMADAAEHDRPGEQEADFEVEDDEEDGDEVEAHVELHARVVEGVEAALVGGELFRVGLRIGDEEGRREQDEADDEGDGDEDDEGQVIEKQCAHGDLAQPLPRINAAQRPTGSRNGAENRKAPLVLGVSLQGREAPEA